jgi:hypothetical protein
MSPGLVVVARWLETTASGTDAGDVTVVAIATAATVGTGTCAVPVADTAIAGLAAVAGLVAAPLDGPLRTAELEDADPWET